MGNLYWPPTLGSRSTALSTVTINSERVASCQVFTCGHNYIDLDDKYKFKLFKFKSSKYTFNFFEKMSGCDVMTDIHNSRAIPETLETCDPLREKMIFCFFYETDHLRGIFKSCKISRSKKNRLRNSRFLSETSHPSYHGANANNKSSLN